MGNRGESAKWATIFLGKARLANSEVTLILEHKRQLKKRQAQEVERKVKVNSKKEFYVV